MSSFTATALRRGIPRAYRKQGGRLWSSTPPCPEQKGAGFWVSKSSAATGNILVRGCVFENFYGRGIFQGKNVTVENCRFVNGPSIPLKFQLAYTVDKWAEGGGCSNAVVRGCVFENCNGKSAGMTLGWIAEIFSGAIVDPASGFKAPARCASRGILVEKIRFKNLRGLAWLANVGENLVFRDNEIEISAGSAKKSYAACVFAGDVKGARIRKQYRDCGLSRRVRGFCVRGGGGCRRGRQCIADCRRGGFRLRRAAVSFSPFRYFSTPAFFAPQ